ncbi:hypothetical protein, partial [Streptomyces sp. NPDC058476]|uniref:hypothetical protein n=1 Tax=Streptomyces sp. NPDC058476 TaxID=3346519 RepID=UPI003652E6C5
AHLQCAESLTCGDHHPLTKQADAAAVITLHRLLRDYFTIRERSDGLARIFRDYQSWKVTQDWFQLDAAEPAPGR